MGGGAAARDPSGKGGRRLPFALGEGAEQGKDWVTADPVRLLLRGFRKAVAFQPAVPLEFGVCLCSALCFPSPPALHLHLSWG